ncbi:hypothetical protein P9133_01835 [Bacillus thuringiensis]|uniref:hypothetical protein n=1 Tax=Bacillus thuringiensis TaxID=1428 RepID=UPI002DB71689|nr:hypothetical protein [Bacillus thuringiensis]MEC3263222.1 hypothetical protein [Bacillus thuringiensis]MED2073552.1 hypothetical protein [Bacillus thuringiensis]MED2218337.1 hypothetical protein [Bacillus thuringiensis]MED2281742.1 hypothetical protein [Bacillus thuringiensis]MED2634452.1 hypothetical protein [Bacillus thuringiensis]
MITTITNYIFNDFLRFIGTISLSATALAALYFILRLASQHVFNKNIEKYKGQITTELEKLKLQNQKTLKDFELYTSKKHEKYPEMHIHLENAYGHVMALRGLNRVLTFENVNEVDLKVYFEELQMTDYDQNRILTLWEINKIEAINEIRKLESALKYALARDKWLKANDYYIYNQLYFSSKVSLSCKEFLKLIFEYLDTLEPGLPITPEITRRNTSLRDDILPQKRENIRLLMQNELTNNQTVR